MAKINDEIEMTTGESGSEEAKKYLLSNESYDLLRSAQDKIRQETDIVPSFRKLINILVNPESVEQLTQRFIERFR